MKFYDKSGKNVYNTRIGSFVGSVKSDMKKRRGDESNSDEVDEIVDDVIMTDDTVDITYQEENIDEDIQENDSNASAESPEEASVDETQIVVKDTFPGGFTYTTDPGETVKKSVDTITGLAEEAKKI